MRILAARGSEKAARSADLRVSREEGLELPKAARHLLEECRMVLPGIQALFGFQLIAVFSQGFSRLGEDLKVLHLVATILTSVAMALVMTPAAYHRIVSPMAVSEEFVRRSSGLLLASMFPLAAGLCLELYLVGTVVLTRSGVIAVVIAIAVFGLFLGLWVLFPARARRGKNIAA